MLFMISGYDQFEDQEKSFRSSFSPFFSHTSPLNIVHVGLKGASLSVFPEGWCFGLPGLVPDCHLRLPRGTSPWFSVSRSSLLPCSNMWYNYAEHIPQSTPIPRIILMYENCITPCSAWPLICRQDRENFMSSNSLFSKEAECAPSPSLLHREL